MRIGILLLMVSVSVRAQVVMTLYTVDEPFVPWMEGSIEARGLDFSLLKMVDARVKGVKFKFVRVPWNRCLHLVRTVTSAACFPMSYLPKREAFGAFPRQKVGGPLYTRARLHSAAYFLYTLKTNKNIRVIKGSLEGLKKGGKIGALKTFSVVERLRNQGYHVDDSSTTLSSVFQKLMHHRVEAVAELEFLGDSFLKKTPSLGVHIKKALEPLSLKPYYLLLNKTFVSSHRALSKKIWKAIADVRVSEAYKTLYAARMGAAG